MFSTRCCFSTVAVTGQNHVWMSPFLAIAALAAISNRSTLSGFWLSACTLVTKFLAFFLCSSSPCDRAQPVGFFDFILCDISRCLWLLVVGGSGRIGSSAFSEERRTGEISANLPYLLSSLGIPMTALAYPAIAAICLAVLFLLIWRIDGRVNVCTTFSYSLVAVFVILLLFSKKAFTSYWIAAFFPLCFVWSDRIVTARPPDHFSHMVLHQRT